MKNRSTRAKVHTRTQERERESRVCVFDQLFFVARRGRREAMKVERQLFHSSSLLSLLFLSSFSSTSFPFSIHKTCDSQTLVIPKFSWHFHLRKRERERGHKNSFWERREKEGKRRRKEGGKRGICLFQTSMTKLKFISQTSSPFVYSPPRKGRDKVRCVVSRESLQETCILWELKRGRELVGDSFSNSLVNQPLKVTLEPSQWKVTVTHEQYKQTKLNLLLKSYRIRWAVGVGQNCLVNFHLRQHFRHMFVHVSNLVIEDQALAMRAALNKTHHDTLLVPYGASFI